MSGVYLAQDSEHQRIDWIDDSVMEVLLDSAATGGQLAVLRSDLPPGAAAPVHVHGKEDEIFLLLKGSMTCWVAESRYELAEGGVAFLPRGLAHAYRVGDAGALLLTLCTPGGLEGFFRAAGHDRSTPCRTAGPSLRRPWELPSRPMAARSSGRRRGRPTEPGTLLTPFRPRGRVD